jgi:hypothetical protein
VVNAETGDASTGGAATVALPPAPWKSDLFPLFISHVAEYKSWVGSVKQELEAQGICAFVAHDDIEPLKEWQDVILSALDTCEALAAILTQDFRTSAWCDQEVGYVLARRKLIIPVRFQGQAPYGFIGRYQALNGPEDAETTARGLFEILVRNDSTKVQMARALVRLFTSTWSFNETRRRAALLEWVPTDAYTEELVQELEKAAKENVDIREAGIDYIQGPDWVAALAGRVRAQINP